MPYLIKWLIKRRLETAANSLQLVGQKGNGRGSLGGQTCEFELQNFSANAKKEIHFKIERLTTAFFDNF